MASARGSFGHSQDSVVKLGRYTVELQPKNTEAEVYGSKLFGIFCTVIPMYFLWHVVFFLEECIAGIDRLMVLMLWSCFCFIKPLP